VGTAILKKLVVFSPKCCAFSSIDLIVAGEISCLAISIATMEHLLSAKYDNVRWIERVNFDRYHSFMIFCQFPCFTAH